MACLRFILPVTLVCFYLPSHAMGEFSSPDCLRPAPGDFRGACEVRATSPELSGESPFALIRWAACLQSKFGLPAAGNIDARFFSELTLEYETEIDANIKTLDTLLSPGDRIALKREQQAWRLAQDKAEAKWSKQSTSDGSLYRVYSSIDRLVPAENRAIELACRVEKLQAK
jgi:hypothetical protein